MNYTCRVNSLFVNIEVHLYAGKPLFTNSGKFHGFALNNIFTNGAP